MHTVTSVLSPLALLHCTGPDAEKFLQDLVTGDVSALKTKQGIFTGVCNPKGRLLASFFIWHAGQDEYYLLLPSSMQEAIYKLFKKYIFRSNINLTMLPFSSEFASAINYITAMQLPDHAPFQNENSWHAHNIQAGLVWIYPETQGLLLPQMINLQKWRGISFKKGCYVGQEIVARTEHLGKLKRHLYRAQITSRDAIKIGMPLLNKVGQAMGIIVEVAQLGEQQYDLLAVLQDQLVTASSFNNVVRLTFS